ncbi:MAG: DVU_1556 family methyltransferase [Desulfococcaceae bacterium]
MELPLYEQPAMRAVTGETARPGGVRLTDRAVAQIGLRPGAPVGDIGCGRGATVRHLRERHGLAAVGIDPSPGMVAEGKDLPLVRGRAETLPWRDGSLAAVFCECVLSLTADPERALAECRRVLAPGGYLALSDLYRRDGGNANGNGPARTCVEDAVTREAGEARLGKAGFQMTLWEDHSRLLAELAGRMVFSHGSLEGFWTAVGLPAGGISCANAAPGARPPGYFLAIGRAGKEVFP